MFNFDERVKAQEKAVNRLMKENGPRIQSLKQKGYSEKQIKGLLRQEFNGTDKDSNKRNQYVLESDRGPSNNMK
ncbi:MAG: hypothetical protein WC627_06690 [Legionella sp.]|jgi:hypothetical protein